MMSLCAPNATFTFGPGRDGVREGADPELLANGAVFQPDNALVSDHPAYKLKVTVNGDKGTLYFECHYVDIETGKVAALTAADRKSRGSTDAG